VIGASGGVLVIKRAPDHAQNETGEPGTPLLYTPREQRLARGNTTMMKLTLAAALAAALLVTGCQSRGAGRSAERAAAESVGTVNPYLWRASLDTMAALPVESADPIGGLIVYDWKSFADAPGERIKATVFILDSRLRADGVKVSVYRQVDQNGTWADAGVDAETGQQLENKILERARLLKASEIG
jgi:Domain of unknown function (DUF3576)